MDNEELLKQKRAKILSELIDKIKDAIDKNKVKGEKSSKIFIYSRLADYTYYSEVSIRKFLTGTLPKDISSFVEGIIQYCKLVGLDEEYIQSFANEYVLAANAIVIKQDNKIKSKNNLIPQDLTSIIRPRKLVKFLDSFLDGEVNISYIYGYSLSGKTKSVMAYVSDLISRNMYENIMWKDINSDSQINQIYDFILDFFTNNKENIDDVVKEESCFNLIKNSNSIIILDFQKNDIEAESILFLKALAKFAKIIIITAVPFSKYEDDFLFFAKSFSTNNLLDADELEQYLKSSISGAKVLDNDEYLLNKLYNTSGGCPFIATYVVKQIIQENKMGVPLNDAITKHLNYESDEYEDLASKIIKSSWNELSNIAKKILIICSKFNCSVSTKLVSYVCGIKITDELWRNAMKELYEKDLITGIILNNPRLQVNNMIKALVIAYSKANFDESNFIEKISDYYAELSSSIGECYNDLDKLKLLDEVDEWNTVTEVLQYLEKSDVLDKYIEIVRELKYYIYVRGMWTIGNDSLHLKRARFANEIGDKSAELEGLCDYINICAKSKNELEAVRYLKIAEKIVEQDYEKVEKRVLCLYYHVKALYLSNCLGEYEKAYKIWKNNSKEFFEYVNEYRRLVNRLWEDRCYLKIEKDINKVCNKLIESCNNAKEKNFTRGIVDYELLIANKKIEQYELTEDAEILVQAKMYLDEANEILIKNSKDIRNEAFYYRLRAMISKHEHKTEEKNNYANIAIELYSLMNCKKDIEFLKQL